MPDSIALRLQNMEQVDQVLVVARIAASRAEDGRTFPGVHVRDLMAEIGLPLPSNISNQLAALLARDSVMKPGGTGLYRLTPAGKARSVELMNDMDVVGLEAEVSSDGGAQLGSATHSVVPPTLAPPDLIRPLQAFLENHPLETNVFGMTRFPEEGEDDDPVDPVGPALEVAREVCRQHGLEFHLASDRAIHDNLWTNIAGHMWASRYGIGFFEDRRDRGVNYNLTIEVGGMITTGRRCALLKDVSIEKLPSDLVGMIYKSVDLEDPDTVANQLHGWLAEDLGFDSCGSCI